MYKIMYFWLSHCAHTISFCENSFHAEALIFALITKRHDASYPHTYIKLETESEARLLLFEFTKYTRTLAYSDRLLVRIKVWQLPSNTAPRRTDLTCNARKPLFIDLWCFPFDLRGPQLRHVFAVSVYCMFSIVISIYQDRNCVVFLSVELKLVVARTLHASGSSNSLPILFFIV